MIDVQRCDRNGPRTVRRLSEIEVVLLAHPRLTDGLRPSRARGDKAENEEGRCHTLGKELAGSQASPLRNRRMPPGSRATMNGTTQTLRLSMGGMLIQRDIRPADRQTCRSRALRVPSVRRVSFQTLTVPPSVADEGLCAPRQKTTDSTPAGCWLESAFCGGTGANGGSEVSSRSRHNRKKGCLPPKEPRPQCTRIEEASQ